MKPAIRIILAPVALRGRDPNDPLKHAPTRGECRGRIIKIDPRAPLPAKTLLHEWIHATHPSWPEERVVATEEIRWSRMSWREKARLLKLLGTASIEGEDESTSA